VSASPSSPKCTVSGESTRKFAAVHDVLLFYTKSDRLVWNQAFLPYSDAYIAEHFVHLDPDGRRFRRSDLRNPGMRPNLHYDYVASHGRTYHPHPNGWAVSLEVMKQLDAEGRLFFPSKEDARLRKKIYIGCSLTNAPEAFLGDIKRLKEALYQAGYEMLDFVGTVDGTAEQVVHTDISCVLTSDLFLAITTYPSIGLGVELGVAAQARKQVIAAGKKGEKATRMVLGLHVHNLNYKYVEYEDILDLIPVVHAHFGKEAK